MFKRRHNRGFTLLEILLVMVLLSLTAVVVVPTFPNKNNDDAKFEAERFYQLIQLWIEKSLVMSKTMGVRVEKDGYSLLELTGNDWAEVTKKGRTVTSVEMPDDVTMKLDVVGIEDTEDQLFSRESLFDEMVFNEEDKKKQANPPQLVLFGNGEIFPFTMTFLANGNELWKVTGTDVGDIKLASFDEDRE